MAISCQGTPPLRRRCNSLATCSASCLRSPAIKPGIDGPAALQARGHIACLTSVHPAHQQSTCCCHQAMPCHQVQVALTVCPPFRLCCLSTLLHAGHYWQMQNAWTAAKHEGSMHVQMTNPRPRLASFAAATASAVKQRPRPAHLGSTGAQECWSLPCQPAVGPQIGQPPGYPPQPGRPLAVWLDATCSDKALWASIRQGKVTMHTVMASCRGSCCAARSRAVQGAKAMPQIMAYLQVSLPAMSRAVGSGSVWQTQVLCAWAF